MFIFEDYILSTRKLPYFFLIKVLGDQFTLMKKKFWLQTGDFHMFKAIIKIVEGIEATSIWTKTDECR